MLIPCIFGQRGSSWSLWPRSLPSCRRLGPAWHYFLKDSSQFLLRNLLAIFSLIRPRGLRREGWAEAETKKVGWRNWPDRYSGVREKRKKRKNGNKLPLGFCVELTLLMLARAEWIKTMSWKKLQRCVNLEVERVSWAIAPSLWHWTMSFHPAFI